VACRQINNDWASSHSFCPAQASVERFGDWMSFWWRFLVYILHIYYASAGEEGPAVSFAFVRPSLLPSVGYIANNSRTRRLSVPKFGMKVPVPHHWYDSHTGFKVKCQGRKVTWSVWAVLAQCCTCVIRSRRGHTVSAEPGGHTSCFHQKLM